MAINETIIASADPFGTIKILTSVIAALGGVVFLYLVFNILNFLWNRKKNNNLKEMNEKIDRIIDLLKVDKKNKK